MRTLGEIIEAIKSGQDPTQAELYWSVLAMDALSTFDAGDIRKMAELEMEGKKGPLFTAEYVYKTSFDRWHRALNKDPKSWVGPNHDPKTTGYQKQREISRRIAKKIADGLGMKELSRALSEKP